MTRLRAENAELRRRLTLRTERKRVPCDHWCFEDGAFRLSVGSPDCEIIEVPKGYAFRYFDNGAVGPVQTDLSAMMLEVEESTISHAIDALQFLLIDREFTKAESVDNVVPIRPVVS